MNRLVVEGLGKCFQLGGASEEGSPFAVARKWQRRLLRRQPDTQESDKARDFWALKDVSFTVEPGTILGVIGANGAGKTTLLKILARVITPTEGRVTGSGRVVSLLELGAGFDPELSARDNVFLNAAMLGIPKAVVQRRFDHIIEFAEVEKFVDTPLKHYSSGMYLRLAFSVAINMEPAILLADEILAVGDLSFQERCLERVKQEADRGLTVLFVSHDMDAIVRVCNRALWLNAGCIAALGDSEELVADYQNSVWARGIQGSERGRHANQLAIMHDLRIVTADGREVRGARTDQRLFFRLRFELLQNRVQVLPAFDLRVGKTLVFRSADASFRLFKEAGIWEAVMRLPPNFLMETTYSLIASLTVSRDRDGRRTTLVMPDPLSFIVYGADAEKSERMKESRSGLLAPRFKWEYVPLQEQPQQEETDVARA